MSDSLWGRGGEGRGGEETITNILDLPWHMTPPTRNTPSSAHSPLPNGVQFGWVLNLHLHSQVHLGLLEAEVKASDLGFWDALGHCWEEEEVEQHDKHTLISWGQLANKLMQTIRWYTTLYIPPPPFITPPFPPSPLPSLHHPSPPSTTPPLPPSPLPSLHRPSSPSIAPPPPMQHFNSCTLYNVSHTTDTP